MAKQQKEKQKPAHEIRIGRIKATIWANQTTDDRTFHSVVLCRIYKDKDDDQWKSTDSFGRDDLLVLAKVADQAHSWIHNLGQEKEEPAA